MQTPLLTRPSPFENYLETMTSGVIVIDAGQDIIYANRVAENWLQPKLIGKPWAQIVKELFKKPKLGKSWMALPDGRKVRCQVSSLSQFEGQVIHLQERITPHQISLTEMLKTYARIEFHRLQAQWLAIPWKAMTYRLMTSFKERCIHSLHSVAVEGQRWKTLLRARLNHLSIQVLSAYQENRAQKNTCLLDIQKKFSEEVASIIRASHSELLMMNQAHSYALHRSGAGFKKSLKAFVSLALQVHHQAKILCSIEKSGQDCINLTLEYRPLSSKDCKNFDFEYQRDADPLHLIKKMVIDYQGSMTQTGELDGSLRLQISLPAMRVFK